MKEQLQPAIKNYWDNWAERFGDIIRNELESFRRPAWKKLILENAPQKEKLKILDIGTGPGLFAIILAEEGHEVTAVDCSEEMLVQARRNSEIYGVNVDFRLMDSHELNFPDDSFDLIVNRNVTWTLYDSEKAYRQWYRVLKKGGRALIFDANWGMLAFDEAIAVQSKADREEHERIYGWTYTYTEHDFEYYRSLYLSDKQRPDWDIPVWESIGCKVSVERNVSTQIWDEGQLLMYSTTPMFMVKAEK